MTVTYENAPDVETIAERLIAKHHPHLAGERIAYVFRSEASKSGGKIVLGKARKISGLNAFLAGKLDSFFVLEIAEDEWRHLPAKSRKALVDHELCHFGLNDDGEPTIKPHDLEEFVAVVGRHGLWKPEVEQFVGVATKQLSLLPDPPRPIKGHVDEEETDGDA